MTITETLARLVSIDSVSSRSNHEIVSYLESRCEVAGFATRRFVHLEADGIEKINFVAMSGADFNGEQPIELALVGHTDTVPYDPAWTDALQLTEKDGRLFGRGACDTKAFIAAALTASESIDLASLKKPFALIFTADEEIGCLGAKRLADARPFETRYAIIGEPTSLQPMRAGKGYCLAEITVHGREAHSAYPQLGVSAIFNTARLIERVENIAADLKTDERAEFDPPHTTLNVGLLNGGTAKNIIAGECRFTLEWRPVPGQETSRVLDLVKQAVADLQKQDPDFACEIEATRADESFAVQSGSALVQFLEELSGGKSGTVAFGTEAPNMISLGAEALVFGPGDIRVAHRTGEFVPIDQLNACADILRQAIERFCL